MLLLFRPKITQFYITIGILSLVIYLDHHLVGMVNFGL
jgi:hypothetical protein